EQRENQRKHGQKRVANLRGMLADVVRACSAANALTRDTRSILISLLRRTAHVHSTNRSPSSTRCMVASESDFTRPVSKARSSVSTTRSRIPKLVTLLIDQRIYRGAS